MLQTAPIPLTRIPQPEAASVRAAAVVASPSEVLAEAVANSLDAGATELSVELDLAAWGLRVQDNGCGIPASSLGLLRRRCVPHAPAARAATTLGYRGEALAAICTVTEEVEVVSRAAGSFETHSLLLHRGKTAHQGLAVEQRSRQGTVISVRGLFFNQPVRRKVLLAGGLRREVERCKQAALHLVLLRPDIMLTCFDHSRKTFLLRLLKGRSQHQAVAQFLGHMQEHVAVVQPVAGTAHAISGYATPPPHGHSNASRQLLLLNGRSVKAPPVSRLVDTVFQQLYKPNMRLQQGQGQELQQVHKAANRHAAFVLCIRCDASQYELSHEANSYVVQFPSWKPLLAAVGQAIIAAWRMVLSNALLKQLEELEGGRAGMQAVAPPCAADDAAHHSPAQPYFQNWLREKHTAAAVPILLLDTGRSRNGNGQHRSLEMEPLAGESAALEGSGSGRHPASGSGQQLAGAKRTLASRLVRYGGAGIGAAGQEDVRPVSSLAENLLAWQEPDGKRARVGPHMSACQASRSSSRVQQGNVQQLQCQQETGWQERRADAASSWVLAGLLPMHGLAQLLNHGTQTDRPGSAQQPMLQLFPAFWRQPLAACATRRWVPLDSEDEITMLIDSWGQQQEGQARQQEVEQCWQDTGGLSLGCWSSKAVDIRSSWMQLGTNGIDQGWHETGTRLESELEWEVAGHEGISRSHEAYWMQRGLDSRAVARHGLSSQDRALLDSVAAMAAQRLSLRRPQSAPPHGQQHRYGVQPWRGSRLVCSSKPCLPPLPVGQAEAAERSGPRQAGGLAKRALALSLTSMPACDQQRQPDQSPAAEFLQPGAGLGVLLASWHQPASQLPPTHAELKPSVLTWQHLAAGRALEQVDRKFVPVVCGSLLALVDQHAADERVQLERLRDQLLGPDGQPMQGYSQKLRMPQVLTEAEWQLLDAYAEKVAAWGWQWQWQPGGASGACGSAGSAVLLLTHAPLLWDTVLTATDLKLYLHHLHDTCGAGGLPTAVVRVLNSKACRGAIMFGDQLDQAQCQQLLDNLKQTQLCFSCAHGRPTTVPLVDLQLLRRALQLRQDAQLTGDGAAAIGDANAAGLQMLKSKLQRLCIDR